MAINGYEGKRAEQYLVTPGVKQAAIIEWLVIKAGKVWVAVRIALE
jgi:hypothetical protein